MRILRGESLVNPQDPPCSIILGRLCSGLTPQLMNINKFFS
jgi:hypothetical protein